MKRRSIDGTEEKKSKRPRSAEVAAPEEAVSAAELGEDLLLEVLKRADARTLGRAACVSRGWRRLAEDERLWEAVCTRDWVKVPCGKQQLRAVVLALGGFRRLHSLYILPFLAPSAALPSPMTGRPHPQQRWGKDEVQLSLSLLSIGFFEKMIPNNNRGGRGGA